MTDLLDLIGYQVPAALIEDGDDDFAPDDPAYITPPIKGKTAPAPEPIPVHDEVWLISENLKMSIKSYERLLEETDPQVFQRELVNFWMEGCNASSRVQSLIRSDRWDDESCEKLRSAIAHDSTSLPSKDETLKSGYIEEKQIKKNGKLVGIYLYERYREGGKLKSKYIGRKKGT